MRGGIVNSVTNIAAVQRSVLVIGFRLPKKILIESIYPLFTCRINR